MELIKTTLWNQTSTSITVLFKLNNKEYYYNILRNTFEFRNIDDDNQHINHEEYANAFKTLEEHKSYAGLRKLQDMHIQVDCFGCQDEAFMDEMNDLEDIIIDERIEF